MNANDGLDALLDHISAQLSQPEAQGWLAIVKEAGQKLDPETAVAARWYVRALDPYGFCADYPDGWNVGEKAWFARSPESDIWVLFGDCPKATCERLCQRMDAGDFNRPADLEPPTPALEIRSHMELELSCWIGRSRFKIDECNQFLDGRFQLVIREDSDGTK